MRRKKREETRVRGRKGKEGYEPGSASDLFLETITPYDAYYFMLKHTDSERLIVL